MYNNKNETTTIYLKPVKETLISDSNKTLLYHIISKQLYVSSNDMRYLQLQKNIDIELNNWVNSGNLNKIVDTASFISNDISLQLEYYNSIFIKNYLNKVTKLDQQQFELDNNPYKQLTDINGTKKLFKDFLPSDYENMNVSNYQNTYTLNGNFNRNYHRIPKYRTEIHHRHVDRSFNANDMLKNESKTNKTYKKYNNDELLNGLSYLQKKSPAKILNPTKMPDTTKSPTPTKTPDTTKSPTPTKTPDTTKSPNPTNLKKVETDKKA